MEGNGEAVVIKKGNRKDFCSDKIEHTCANVHTPMQIKLVKFEEK